MADIQPFKALRFGEKAGKIEELVCPPYDIISEEQRLNYLATNPNNVIRLELPKEGNDVYKQAGQTLQTWLEKEILKLDAQPGYYIYEEAFALDGRSYSFKGLVARVRLTDFDEGVVIPHENTLSAAKEDRFQLMQATGCNFSQVYCLFEDQDTQIETAIDKASNCTAINSFSDADGVTHRLWATTDTAELTDLFKGKCLYIADGHHRYETALRYRNTMREKGSLPDSASEYVMMMLVPMESKGLVVFPTHRVVHDLSGFDPRAILLNCRDYFHVGEMSGTAAMEKNLKAQYADSRTSFGMYCGGRYYLLTLKNVPSLSSLLPELDETLRDLDVTVLHSLILERILGIDKENMSKQLNLSYTRDISEATRLVDAGANCAFFLNPTRISQIAAVGKAGQKMPQKSTYFYPKLITGLVMNKII